MTSALRPVGLDYLDAPDRCYQYAEPVGAPAAAVFAAISSDPSTWTWFPGLDAGSYEGHDPPGIGTRRWVTMADVTYRETVLAWDEPRRWAYRVDECSVGLFAVLLEDWVVESVSELESVVHWTFAFEPLPETTEALAGAQELIGTTFHDAMLGLSISLSAPDS